VVWRDEAQPPALANLKQIYDGIATNGNPRPTSAPFVSQPMNFPRPKLQNTLQGQIGTTAAYGPSTNRIYSNRNPVDYVTKELNKMRPKSAVSESYTRRKYSFDVVQRNAGLESNTPWERTEGSGIGGVNGGGGDRGSNAAHAESIIDRVVNYGKDIPHYLLPKGSKRAQSAGRYRSDSNRSDRNKQLAMMYAEELIEKLDSRIGGRQAVGNSNPRSRDRNSGDGGRSDESKSRENDGRGRNRSKSTDGRSLRNDGEGGIVMIT